ncbi:MAG: cyclase family protein [Gammaproteobacteria bacterium]
MRREIIACLLLGLSAQAAESAAAPGGDDLALWQVYQLALLPAKYIDLTHAFAPGQPLGSGFAPISVGPALAGVSIPGVIAKGEPFSYEKLGAGITRYELSTDQIATQLDPPAHMNAHGATISELPPTFAVRPLVVINLAAKVAADPGYAASLVDVTDWERAHGRIPHGSVVMFRSDWSKRWNEPLRFTSRPFPGVSLEALKFLHLQRHILFHGHEPLDTDATADFEAERWLLRHNYAQAEGVMNLDLLPQAGALISIGYAKPEGGTGGLARYIAIVPQSWPHGVTIAQAPGAPLPTYPTPLRRDAQGVLRRQ